ncbi:MAG: extracellular solute-binding protein [Hyphomicrobiales bacterium]|jgi:putative spermidine/putrescine transport system substrate-binding protein|nr:extracellular solute-binding protein [Hyphomicrobiales bacterium]
MQSIPPLSSRLSRRRFLAASSALALSGPAFAQNTAVSGQITLMAYAGIFQDNYIRTVVEPFQGAFPNVKVNYTAGGTSAQMLGTIRAQKADPQVDVVIFDVSTSGIGNAEGLFSRITPEEAPSLAELYPEARAVGGPFGPAVTYDHLVLVFDRQNLNPPLTKLADLWRPDLRGLLAISAPPNIQGLAMTAMVTKMAGGDHVRSIDPGISKLRELASSIQTYDPNPDGYTLILNGVVRVATGWNARAQLYSDETNGRLGVVLPPEGSVFQINTINIPEGAKNRAAAVAFVNYALSRAAQKAFTERMFYAPTNAQADVAPAALARTAASAENRARMIPVDWAEIAKVRDQWNNRWRREIISVR